MKLCFNLLIHTIINRKKITIVLLVFFLLLLLMAGVFGIILYGYFFKPNVTLNNQKYDYLYIPTGSRFEDVFNILKKNKFLTTGSTFEWVSKRKNYPEKVRPGKYRIRDGMSNNELVNLLRSGRQEPVRVTFLNIRRKEDLAGRISRQIEADSLSLIRLLKDGSFLNQYGVTTDNAFVLFIPNTYEFYWNTSAKGFISRMAQEKKKFWNNPRLEKCKRSGLTIPQVVTLASIIEKETNQDVEKPVIAGVYMNRLKKGWLLQADPTIIYAWNDYSIKRILNYHLKINSPYNTYLYPGLPPGPICLPSVCSIDAVLNFVHSDYFYFCAKADLSGYHVFAATLADHSRNAKKYQDAIKKEGIH